MSSLPPSTNQNAIQQQPALNFATLVKNWIHYDNLASSFYKQTLNARKIRSEYESQIQDNLQKQKMENAVIQVNGGKISVVEEKQPAPLTMLKLEDLLHNYFQSSNQMDKTREILEYVRENRGITSSKRLRYV